MSDLTANNAQYKTIPVFTAALLGVDEHDQVLGPRIAHFRLYFIAVAIVDICHDSYILWRSNVWCVVSESNMHRCGHT